MNADDFRLEVIRPVLQRAKLWSFGAEYLLLRTAMAESGLGALVQLDGPALGVYQIEPATHNDIWKNYLAFRPVKAARVLAHSCSVPQHRQLIWNLGYATLIARIVYLRSPLPLPAGNDLRGQALIWKEVYNTVLGKGTLQHFEEMNQ